MIFTKMLQMLLKPTIYLQEVLGLPQFQVIVHGAMRVYRLMMYVQKTHFPKKLIKSLGGMILQVILIVEMGTVRGKH